MLLWFRLNYVLACCKTREAELGQVAVRSRDIGELGSIELDAFISKVVEEIAERSLQTKFEKVQQ